MADPDKRFRAVQGRDYPPCYDVPETLLSPRAKIVFAVVIVMALGVLVLG